MNSYQIALDFLSEECRTIKKSEAKKHINTLQELVEKATPKKPKKERVYDEVWDCTLTVATCSNCACEVCNGTNYCENCGYALDWSEE